MEEIIPYNNNLKPFARELRDNMTSAENILWQKIRRKQILHTQFLRQKTIGNLHITTW